MLNLNLLGFVYKFILLVTGSTKLKAMALALCLEN